MGLVVCVVVVWSQPAVRDQCLICQLKKYCLAGIFQENNSNMSMRTCEIL